MIFAACAGDNAGMIVFRLLRQGVNQKGNAYFINIITIPERSQILVYSLPPFISTYEAKQTLALGYKPSDQSPTLMIGTKAIGFIGPRLSYSEVPTLTFETSHGTIIAPVLKSWRALDLISRSQKNTLTEMIRDVLEKWKNSESCAFLTSQAIVGIRGKKGDLYVKDGNNAIVTNIKHQGFKVVKHHNEILIF